MQATLEAQLAPGFIGHNGDSVGQIEAAAILLHGQAQYLTWTGLIANILWQASGFGAKQEAITGLILYCGITADSFGAECINSPAAGLSSVSCPAGMDLQ